MIVILFIRDYRRVSIDVTFHRIKNSRLFWTNEDFGKELMRTFLYDFSETGAVFTIGRSRFADNVASHFFIRRDPVVSITCGDEHSAVICRKLVKTGFFTCGFFIWTGFEKFLNKYRLPKEYSQGFLKIMLRILQRIGELSTLELFIRSTKRVVYNSSKIAQRNA